MSKRASLKQHMETVSQQLTNCVSGSRGFPDCWMGQADKRMVAIQAVFAYNREECAWRFW